MLNFVFISLSAFIVIFIGYTYAVKLNDRRCDTVIYKYRPYIRTFQEEQTNPVSPSGLFKDMFYKPGPWWESTGNASFLKDGTIQPFSWQGLPKSEVLIEGESSNFVNQ